MPTFRIRHLTKYEYDRQIRESVNEIKIFPIPSDQLQIRQHELTITGNPEVYLFRDYWGNTNGNFNLMSPHNELSIDSRLVVQTTADDSIHVDFNPGFDSLNYINRESLQMIELSRQEDIHTQSEIEEIVRTISKDSSIAETAWNCCDYIYTNFKYLKGITNVETTVDEILLKRVGVCQDFAHLMLQVMRTLGVPSRYTSGYICPNKKDIRGEGATHAWVEFFIPGSGWTGIDPTNRLWVTNNYVQLATGRRFNDCSPVKGSFKGPADQHLSVFVSVVYEDGQTSEELTDVKLPGKNNVRAISQPQHQAQQ